MQTSFTPGLTQGIMKRLRDSNRALAALYPGDSGDRQAVHTVYGGAHIFKAGTAQKMGAAALKQLTEYAPTFVDFAGILQIPGWQQLPTSQHEIAALAAELAGVGDQPLDAANPATLAYTVYQRVIEKLQREPVEDFRIDFEDGYGNRPDSEEDEHAAAAAGELLQGMSAGSLPPFIGIRIKPFTEELKVRAVRTLDIFVTTLAAGSGGKLPANFVVTLPKITTPEQVAALVDLFKILESETALPADALRLELMVETTQSILNHRGESALPLLAMAAEGRCVAAHFGVYDYTASIDITAAYQSMTHPACDVARHMMQLAFAGTSIRLSDGATNIMPVPPHRGTPDQPLTDRQAQENRAAVHHGWKLGFDHIQHSLQNGFYQGWDLHPAQLPIRYGALYTFFLQGLEAASLRLRTFIDMAAKATLVGNVFDDAATGQALLNYFLRGIGCGALTEKEVAATGLSLDDIRTRSFKTIMDRR